MQKPALDQLFSESLLLQKTRLIGFAATIVFMALAVWSIDLRSLGGAFASADYFYAVPAALCTLLSYLLRTVRWQRVLKPIRSVSLPRLFPVLMIGFMANNLLPARIGEIVRAYALGQKEGVSKSLSLATIFLERLLDGVTLVFILAVVSMLLPLPEWGADLAYIASAVFAVAGTGVLLLLVRDDLAERIVQLATRPLPERWTGRVSTWADSFVQGLHSFRRKRIVLLLLGYSAVIWTVEAASYLLVLRAFDVRLLGATPLTAAFLMLVVVNLGILIPSAPGYVGTFQFFGVLALGVVGVQRELALSAAILSHGSQYVLVTGIGLLCLWRENLSVRRLSEITSPLAASSAVAAAEPSAPRTAGYR